MLSKLAIALVLMATCVVIHASGISWAIRWSSGPARRATRFWQWMAVFIRIASWVILVHLLEVTVWGTFYAKTGGMPDFESATYFSAVTYTTTGYGDLTLPQEWRLVGAVEALTGILMCGWSTGFFFAVVGRMFETKGSPPSDVS
jgi:hypothetical protein